MTIPPGVLAQHVAILGKTGSGKTSTAKLCVEQVVASGARVCILDPIKSDWWGLTSSADGKRPGLPFQILGGDHGHAPLHASAGKAIGEVVASGALPLSIIDMADFEGGDHARFFVDFARTLFKRNRGVVYLVIEEAHIFAPKERSGIGAENLSIHWAKMLATGSRTKGIRLIVATQRTQALHNAVLGSCDTMIACRMTAPADQEPVVKWLKANTDRQTTEKVAASLSSLKTGTGWLCSGEAKAFELIEFPRIKTYDNTATPTGDAPADNVKTAPVDAEKLRTIIGEAVKTAEANDPAALKKRIAELERQGKAQGSSQADLLAAEQRGYDRGLQAARATVAEALRVAIQSATELTVNLRGISQTIEQPPNIVPVAYRAPVEPRKLPARPTGSPASAAAAQSDLPRGEVAILSACIQYPDGLRREQLTVLTGYRRSTRDAYIQRLRERGYLDTAGDKVTATAEGIGALPDARPLPVGAALQEFWTARLPDGERKILSVLIDGYPNTVDRESLDDSTGFKRSTRDAYLQRLTAKELVSEPRSGASE